MIKPIVSQETVENLREVHPEKLEVKVHRGSTFRVLSSSAQIDHNKPMFGIKTLKSVTFSWGRIFC